MSIPDGKCSGEINDTDGEELELEPEIKIELDHLNSCSAEINRLENELDEARSKYRQTFHEASNKMSQVSQKNKRSISKAREYFELKKEEKMVQGESLKAARQYQSAIGIYKAAKETVSLAEDRLVKGGEVQLSSAWQEMLNHATQRVMEAEVEKRRSEEQHSVMTRRCCQLEQKLHSLEKTKKRSIANARPYFELKQQLDLKLQQQKQNVIDLQNAIKQAKTKYSKSLHKLEEISLAIHQARRDKLLLMYPRQPGVGAECDSLNSSVSELTLGKIDNDLSLDEEISQSDDENDEKVDEGSDISRCEVFEPNDKMKGYNMNNDENVDENCSGYGQSLSGCIDIGRKLNLQEKVFNKNDTTEVKDLYEDD